MPKGVYLVEATNGDLRAYTVVIISELGLVTKATSGQIVTFAADRRTGAPVANASVLVWSDKKELTKLISDSNGLAESSLPQQKYEDVRVLASSGEDVAVVTPYSYSLSSNPDENWKGYVYTDRPVYRPGHTVHFKVILRTRSGERYKVPAGEQIQVVIQDPASKPVYQSNLPVFSFGTVHGEMVLLDTAALGYYFISVNTAGSRRYCISGGFYVEEYTKPEYEVKVTPVKPRVLQGESNTATIEAKYYFGEPVAGANVKWVVHTSPYWSPFMDREENEEGSIDAAAGESEGEKVRNAAKLRKPITVANRFP
ncbi:MAG: MG2 domain-containing protein, partial [Candidatus Acidiferrales bacterium]